MLDDGLPTSTTTQQNALEKKLLALYQELDSMEPEDVTDSLRLLRSVHITYLHSGLGKLPSGFGSLDASRPWLVYWILHSLALLGADMPPEGPSSQDVVEFLCHCQSPQGGFGGGPLQIPHLAPTYAAVCALITLGGDAALTSINREATFSFLNSLIIPPENGGGFCIHQGGEADLRACYLAVAVAHMLCLDVQDLATRSGVVEYIKRCQTYEGGLGGEPFNEAHGGYTFCGLATLCILGQAQVLGLPALVHWAAQRQGTMEGGFNGRTNKLVDGCYSFWQGGLFALLQRLPQTALTPPVEGATPLATSEVATHAALLATSVPPLPQVTPKSPVEQAAAVLAQRQTAAQHIISMALQAGDRADAGLHGGSERATAGVAQEARVLLDQAGQAQAAAETAHLNVSAASCSAGLMFPLPDPSDPPLPAVLVQGSRTMHLGPPLYNYKALQLWILRCCQQLRGGLKDKPGKPADFYHTCYCLSGLSSAQNASNCVLGPRENQLKRSDPMVNVLEERLEAARKVYAARPLAGGEEDMVCGESSGGLASQGSKSSGKMDVDACR